MLLERLVKIKIENESRLHCIIIYDDDCTSHVRVFNIFFFTKTLYRIETIYVILAEVPGVVHVIQIKTIFERKK